MKSILKLWKIASNINFESIRYFIRSKLKLAKCARLKFKNEQTIFAAKVLLSRSPFSCLGISGSCLTNIQLWWSFNKKRFLSIYLIQSKWNEIGKKVQCLSERSFSTTVFSLNSKVKCCCPNTFWRRKLLNNVLKF